MIKDRRDDYCVWTFSNDDNCYWATDCGHSFQFIDGSPKENHMKFCPYCGKKLTTKSKTGSITLRTRANRY